MTDKVTKKPPGESIFEKCDGCGGAVLKTEMEASFFVCKLCGHHETIRSHERVRLLLDDNSFIEMWNNLAPVDSLGFVGTASYVKKIEENQKKTGMLDACVTGTGMMNGKSVAFGATDPAFLMGSLGSVVGEKIYRLFEFANKNALPVIFITGSGGGARMYEGTISLMQMSKTLAAIRKFRENGGFYVVVLTNPTMAGVMASFAAMGDVVIAEPHALIGFTGPRVIEQTIKQKLPPDFQTSEFNLQHGFIDMIVDRKNLKEAISRLLNLFSK